MRPQLNAAVDLLKLVQDLLTEAAKESTRRYVAEDIVSQHTRVGMTINNIGYILEETCDSTTSK